MQDIPYWPRVYRSSSVKCVCCILFPRRNSSAGRGWERATGLRERAGFGHRARDRGDAGAFLLRRLGGLLLGLCLLSGGHFLSEDGQAGAGTFDDCECVSKEP
jgi:hypothetical protein